jgi:hypothetical protein
MKQCNKCLRELPLESFAVYKRAKGKEYRRGKCVDCLAFSRSIWYYENHAERKQKSKMSSRTFRANNPGYSGRKTKQVVSPEKRREYKRRYYAKPEAKAKKAEYEHSYYHGPRHDVILHQKRLSKKRRQIRRVFQRVNHAQ